MGIVVRVGVASDANRKRYRLLGRQQRRLIGDAVARNGMTALDATPSIFEGCQNRLSKKRGMSFRRSIRELPTINSKAYDSSTIAR